MFFDSLVLAAVAVELEDRIVGGKVERVTQPASQEILLTFYYGGAKHTLLLSCEPEAARLHLTTLRRENPPEPPLFCALLRRHLTGGRLVAATLPSGFGERVLHLTFAGPAGPPFTLIAEIMGRHSNLVLVDGTQVVLGAAKLISRQINRVRETLPGLPYTPPPRPRGKHDPLAPFQPPATGPMDFDAGAAWLQATFQGISPLLAREAAARAETPLTGETLWWGLNKILTLVRAGDYAPRVWSEPGRGLRGAYPIPLLSVPAADQQPRSSISAALDEVAQFLEQEDAFLRARDALRSALGKTRKAREKEREEVGHGLANAARAETFQQSGELLLAYAPAGGRGQETISVPDYYAGAAPDGAPVQREIPLDPVLDPRENAERYFKKARKARDSRDTLAARQVRVGEEISALEAAEAEAERAASEADIARVRARVATLLGRTGQPGGSENDEERRPETRWEGHKIKTFQSVDGWEILVGENATSNDFLTTRVAASSDIWLHVRAAASAHGVIRARNRPAAVSPAALQQAAELVAARSEVKHSRLVPVDYTLKKYVRKPRKSAPGAVTYQNEKTLYVTGIHG